MTFEMHIDSLRSTVSQFLVPIKISEIAVRIGFDIKADFTPGEYRCIVNQTTTIVLERLKRNPHSQGQNTISRETVMPIVDEILSEQCKLAPKNTLFPYHETPPILRNGLASLLWRITGWFSSSSDDYSP
jgi:hypothetical protein